MGILGSKARHRVKTGALALASGLLWLAQAAGASELYVTSEKDNRIYMFDTQGNRLGEIDVCERPRHMEFSRDGKTLYVCCGNSNELGVVDLRTRKMVGRMGLGDSPEIFGFSSDQGVIYVSIEEENVMAAYDMRSGKRLFSVPTAGEPEGVYVTPDNKLAYVTSEVGSLVHVVDLTARKVVKDIKVGKRPRRFVAVGQDEIWVSNELSSSVSVIDLKTQAVKETIVFKVPGMRASDIMPVGMVLAKDGKTVWVGLGRANHVAQVDVATRKVRQLVLAGKRAWGVDLDPTGKTMYVVNGLSDDMTVVDVSGDKAKAVRSVPAGRVPHSVLVSP